MKTPASFLTSTLKWLFKAVLLGSLAGYGVTLLLNVRRDYIHTSVLIGVIFSLVMWGGFEFIHDPFRRFHERWNPTKVGLAAVGWMLVLYNALLAVSVLLVRAVTGLNLWHEQAVLVVSGLIGLAISGILATKETVTSRVQAERKLAQAEARALFLALKAQLQPHTLFNALNTIASLIHEDPQGAEEATLRLSALLRNILGALERPEWPLAEEFRLLEDFLRLEELRFGQRLTFTLELDPAMADQAVQPLLLLPLAENSLKHGFRPKVGNCTLAITARDGRVQVQDDGVGRAPHCVEGVGLRTVRERLEAAGGALSFPPVTEGCRVEVVL